ncbi:unnamed protein product [Echinostoma caproni]|uniref:DUF7041 domain-containing protein n=1 Tax=Echinostoma caproni TaxID=27848 RepID=A0A183BAH8_9TREM|nr:unnamed protein product [Echinostoma caproni]
MTSNRVQFPATLHYMRSYLTSSSIHTCSGNCSISQIGWIRIRVLTSALIGKEHSSTAATNESSVLGLQARLPEFIPKDPEFWLAQVEAQFKLAKVTNQLAKFTFGMPVECRLKQLLGGLRLGDNGLDTPTKLLSYMQGQAASLSINENILRLSWLQALPKSLSSILQYFGQRYTLTELAEMADRIYAGQMSVQSYTQPPPPSQSTDNAELVACVKALVAQVQALTLA